MARVVRSRVPSLAERFPRFSGPFAFQPNNETRVYEYPLAFFTEPIEPAFCRLEVMDAAGERVDTPAPEHPAPDVLRVALPSLAPGEYTVHWAVVSVDTHPTEGHFTFSVKKPRS